MPADHDSPTENLQSTLRRLVPVALFAAVTQCGCASTLSDDRAFQVKLPPFSAEAAPIARVSLSADEPSAAANPAGLLKEAPTPDEDGVESTRQSGRTSGRRIDGGQTRSAARPADRGEQERPASGHSLIPRVAAEPVSSAEGAGRTAATGRATTAVPAAEPGMLDRFRALYAPRAEPAPRAEAGSRTDDASERLRRQMLRWSDPFGLMKDREAGDVENGAMDAQMPSAGTSATAELPATGEPLTGGSPLEAVIESLEQELREWPELENGRPERIDEWRRRQTDLRMLYCVAGRSADAARVIGGLPREEQEFWQSLMLAVNQYRSSGVGPERTVQLTEALNQVRAAERHLRPLSQLEIYRLQFCTRIDGFGNATAFPTADFEPGQRLLLYAGVRNFRSELTGEGRYRSEFAAVVEFLREEDGEVLERIRLPQIPDECDEERTDYFQSFELTAPVLEGNYIVRLHLRDQLTRQTAESRLRMTIR